MVGRLAGEHMSLCHDAAQQDGWDDVADESWVNGFGQREVGHATSRQLLKALRTSHGFKADSVCICPCFTSSRKF
jgi:hypothetical protein